jgi:hypothetical protein
MGPPISLEEAYRRQLQTSVDLHEHMPMLRELSSRCEWVTEISSWLHGGLTALAAGKPKHLVSICHDKKPEWQYYNTGQIKLGEDSTFQGIIADPTTTHISDTDMLFISTRHNAATLRLELANCADQVRKWIVLQNTTVYGENGDDGSPGLMVAVREWLANHPEWHIREERTNNNGMLVLEHEGTESGDPLPSPWDHKPPPDPATTPPPTASSLEETYHRHRKWDTPINQHMDALREMASKADEVVELGVATASSTVALLSGLTDSRQNDESLHTMHSVDINIHPVVQTLVPLVAGRLTWQIVNEDSRQCGPWPCDLLFIDSAHNTDQLYAELRHHAPLCRHHIVLHDTVTYGERGEGDDQPANLPPRIPGLMPAVRRYLREHPEWTVLWHKRHSHGLMCLTRDPQEKKALPPLWRQAWNAFKATWRNQANVIGKLGPAAGTSLQEGRLGICTLCESRSGEVCGECACPLNEKTSWPKEFCPLAKWHEEGNQP